MKLFTKIFMMSVLFSSVAMVSGYAEEAKTGETQAVTTSSTTTTVVTKTSGTVVASASAAAAAVTAPAPVVPKTTLGNLQAAYNGESNAHVRYLVFAAKAETEGYGKVASLFRAAAQAEQVHLERHAKVIQKMGAVPVATIDSIIVKSTAENVAEAFKGETYESTVMYPEFLALAKQDKNADAIDAFEDANAAEAVHAKLYKGVLDSLQAWKVGPQDFFVCPVCGNVVDSLGFRKCPICNTSKKKFLTIR